MNASRRLAMPCGLLALLLLAVPAGAESYRLDVTAVDGGDRYWFEFQGFADPNPTLSLRSGDHVTLRLINGGNQPHNIHFGAPISRGTDYLQPGSSQTIEFTVPGGVAPQTIEYWCDPHRQFGMVGDVLLAGGDGDGQARVPDEQASAPLAAALAAVVAALLARRHG